MAANSPARLLALLLLPAIICLAVFFVLPTVFNFVYAFTDWYHRSKIQFFLYRSVEFSDDVPRNRVIGTDPEAGEDAAAVTRPAMSEAL